VTWPTPPPAWALPAVLLATSLGPGLLVVRRFRWNPLEKLCAAVAVSLFATYLFALVRFILHLAPSVHIIFGWLCFACLLASLPTLRTLFRARAVRRTVLAFALLLAWVLALLALTRHYSGALTSGDWHIHYDKAVFFLNASPHDASVGKMVLDRPPALNLIWSHVMAQVGTRFDTFQITAAYFATLALLPCCLLAPALLRRGNRRRRGRPDPLLIAGLLALSPLFVQNATYTWTKLPSVFCVIFGIALYRSGARKRDTTRLAFALATLAFGCLIHFTAVPFALFVVLHYLARGRWRDARWWRQSIVVSVCTLLVLGSWYGWTFSRFGFAANVAANPSVRTASKGDVQANIARAAYNGVNTLVPYYVRRIGPLFTQRSTLGWVRDHAFLGYSANLYISVGSLAGVLVAWLLWRDLAPVRRPATSRLYTLGAIALVISLMYIPPARDVLAYALPSAWLLFGGMGVLALVLASLCRNIHGRAVFAPEQRFWRGLIACAFVVSIAAWDSTSDVGIAHICMQPLAIMGIVLLAVNLPVMSLWLRAIAVLGMTIDFAVGILLHFHMQHQIFTPTQDPGLIEQAKLNWLEKQTAGFTFVGDHFEAMWLAIEGLLVMGFIAAVWWVVRSARSRTVSTEAGGASG
jgi:hypothetical protein